MQVPTIIGHRGARTNAPENTLAGLRRAHEEGATWVEFDEKLTRDGVLVITAQRFREQDRNRTDARERLVEIIRRAAFPQKTRRPTKIPKSSKKKRLDGKKHRARIKQDRSRTE